jgi:hypothetical protein
MFDCFKKVVLVIVLVAIPLIGMAQGKCPAHLFYFAKSDNKNVLYYDLKLANGQIDPKKPIDIYWIMNEKKGQREGFAIGEEGQFGVKTREVEKGIKYIVNVKNELLNKRDIALTLKEDGCADAIIKLNGKDAILKSIYANIPSKSALGLPNVSHLDIKGASVEDGSELTERVVNPKFKD